MTTEQKLRILEIVQEIFEANKHLLAIIEELEPQDAEPLMKVADKIFNVQDSLTTKSN